MKNDDQTGDGTFVFYPTFRQQLKAIRDDKSRLALYEAIADYGVTGEAPDFTQVDPTGLLGAVFVPIKYLLDTDRSKREMRAESGRKGRGNPNFTKGKPNPYYTVQEKPPEPPTDTKTAPETPETLQPSGGNEKPHKPRTTFHAPTLDEITAYSEEAGLNIDTQAFFDYYTANGWQVGKNKMKDWRATARNWARRESEYSRSNTNNPHNNGNTNRKSSEERDREFALYAAAKLAASRD